MTLSFPPRPSLPRPRKRARALDDIDGEHSCLQKKKRRLRLFLITSRLSPQFSHPATNIVDRGSSKIAVWAKQRSLGRSLLRKAAILNRIRRRSVSVKEKEAGLGGMFVEGGQEQKQLELAKLAFVYGSHDTHTRPVMKLPEFPPTCAVRTENPFEKPVASSSATPPPISSLATDSSEHGDNTPVYRSPNDAYSYSPSKAQNLRKAHLPLPPSPLGLSNYDAFDLEDDIHDPYSHLDDDDDEEDDTDGGRSPSANTLASFTSLSTSGTGISEITRSPPQISFCDFSILDHGEPVMGDYDQVDQGADPIWPRSDDYEAPTRPLLPASSSPNFTALFATSSGDTGASSPNFTTVSLDDSGQNRTVWDWAAGSEGKGD